MPEPALNRLFRHMVSLGASDLHLSSTMPPLVRMDGHMKPLEASPVTSPLAPKRPTSKSLDKAGMERLLKRSGADTKFLAPPARPIAHTT